MPDCLETWYCLEIQVASTEDGEMAPPPTCLASPCGGGHALKWEIGQQEVVVTGPSQAILFYGRQSLGEGLSLGEVQDAMFTLSGAISWVGKQAQLNANPVSLGEGWWLITQTITEWHIEPRGPEHPCSIPASPLFCFCNQGVSLQGVRLPTATEWLEMPGHNHWGSYHDWGWASQFGWEHGHRWWDPWTTLPPSPMPSLDCGFESGQSSASTSSSVLSRSDRSGGSRHYTVANTIER